MSTYSLYNYTCDDGEDVFYINNSLISSIEFPSVNNRGCFHKLDVCKEVVDVTINQSGLSKINIWFHVLDNLNDSCYNELKECFIYEK